VTGDPGETAGGALSQSEEASEVDPDSGDDAGADALREPPVMMATLCFFRL
jgi:hypothetical protein